MNRIAAQRATTTLGRWSALRRGFAFTVGVAIAATTLVACGDGSGGNSAEAGKVPDSIVMTLRNDVDTFDPALSAVEMGAVQMYEALYDTPVRQDLKSGGVAPGMATKWEVTPSKIVFQLRPDLKCSDGTDLPPSAVAKSMKRLADPKSGSPFTGRVFGAGGAKSIVGDDETDTLTIEVNEPHVAMLEAMTNAFVVCPKGLKDLKGLATTPQGSGPYKITSMKRGDTYKLEAWGSPALSADQKVPGKITMKVITSDSTRANLFETGAVDIAGVLGRDSKRLERNRKPIQGKAFGTDSVSFNERTGRPLSDERLRRVVAHALSPRGYTKAASFGVGTPARTVITPNMNCYTEDNAQYTPEFDLDKAKAELKAAGYGPGGKELIIELVGYDVQNSGPEYMADALRKVGIKVNVTDGSLIQMVSIIYGEDQDWDMVVYPFQTGTRTPFWMIQKMSSLYGEGGALNWGRVNNEKFNAIVKELPKAEGAEYCKLWGEAEAALLKRVDFVPLMQATANFFAKDLTFVANFRVINLRSIRTTKD